jgi:hypothetical protein
MSRSMSATATVILWTLIILAVILLARIIP